METLLKGYSAPMRLFYKIAGLGLYPTIASAIGFAFIGAPSSIQLSIRRTLPLVVRKHMLMLLTYDGWLVALFLIAVFFAIWGSVGSQITVRLATRKYNEATAENIQLKEAADSKNIDCFKVFSNYLCSYAQRFELSTNERINLYKLDLGMFICIGRYSENELFKSRPTRLYPKNQGCIAKAWEKGTFQDAGAPDPKTDFNAWKRYNIEKFNFTDEQISKIRMQSVAFYGIRLKNNQDVTVAVLVFESISSNGIPFGKIQRFFKNHELNNLANLVESLKHHMPSLEDAQSEGF